MRKTKTMITELTKEQESKLEVYRDLYLDKFFSKKNTPAKLEEVREYMHWVYNTFDVSPNKKPEVILLDSPAEILMAISLIENEAISTLDNIEEEVRSALSAGESYKWYYPTDYISAFNSWVSFYEFFNQECDIKLDAADLFDKYKKVLDLNIFWSISFENYVFVSRNAIEYHRDAETRLHNVNGPAVLFNDLCKFYFIHGVAITEKMFVELTNQTYTFEQFAKENNEEVKSAVLSFIEEKFGTERMYHFISSKLKEIDTYVDKKPDEFMEGTTRGMNLGVYTLLKGRVGETQLAFIRCFCPSTDRMFYLGVHPGNKTAKDGIASLYRIPKKLSSHIKYIQRQGERFSTVLTEEGKHILTRMSKEELGNLTHISGNKYFDLMRYEF